MKKQFFIIIYYEGNNSTIGCYYAQVTQWRWRKNRAIMQLIDLYVKDNPNCPIINIQVF